MAMRNAEVTRDRLMGAALEPVALKILSSPLAKGIYW